MLPLSELKNSTPNITINTDNTDPPTYNALVVVSFGGPEGVDQVDDFLQRVTAGKNIPKERLEEVKGRYLDFDGVSPLNENNRKLVSQLEGELKIAGVHIPVYLGNRNSPPFLADTFCQMKKDITAPINALAFITSPFASYSSCQQYLENIQSAIDDVEGKVVPKNGNSYFEVHRLRHFYNHPLFIEIHVGAIRKSLEKLPENSHIIFSAHSLPLTMAEKCDYSKQLQTACELIMTELSDKHDFDLGFELAYQSISGPPNNWLGPDILTAIGNVKNRDGILVSPLGFLSAHFEVIFDLDVLAKKYAKEHGLEFERASTAQDDERFASLVVELVKERMKPESTPLEIEARSLDGYVPADNCEVNCCL